MKRSVVVGLCVALVLVFSAGGCARKGPLSVRFTRQIDEEKLKALPKREGRVIVLVDQAFWTDRSQVRKIPIVRREKNFIIGPGAAEMARRMLGQIFDEALEARTLNEIETIERFDYIIRLTHEGFDDRTLYLPLFSQHRYKLTLGANVSRLDGMKIGSVSARGSEWFLRFSLLPTDPRKHERPLLEKASRTLNAAVQESLFGMMDELEELFEADALP